MHFVGAFDLGLVLMNDVGFLLQLVFDEFQPLFIFNDQFVDPLLGKAGELVSHVANRIPANDYENGGGASNQVEEVGNGVGGVRHGFVSHREFLVHNLLDQLGAGVHHFLAQCFGFLQ